jgi:ATP-binding cassette, subfamily B, multidrug efflux pump
MKSLSYLNKYFIKYKWRMLLGVLFLFLSNLFKVQMPLFVRSTTNSIFSDGHLNDSTNWLLVCAKIGGLYMFLALIRALFLFLTRQSIIITSRLIEFDLKNEIYNQYQKLDYSFYKKNNTGDLMNRISEDVSRVRMYLGPSVMYTVDLTFLSSLIIYHMVQISPTLTLWVLVPLPIMSVLIYFVSNRMNKLSHQVQKEQSKLSTIAQETFSGIRVIKAYNRVFDQQNKFDESSDSYKDKSMKLVRINALFMPTIMFLIGLSTLIAIYKGGLLYYAEEIKSEEVLGDLVAFVIFVSMLTWPFASLGWVTSIIQRAAASQERINEFLKVEPKIKNPNQTPFFLEGNIEFRNVSYTYPTSGIQAIKNLSFKVSAGESFAVVGRTGSGKSTLLNLIMRQFDPQEGDIFIDGINLKEINLESLRDQSGVVPQEVFLFSDTIKNNILFGTKSNVLTDEELIQVTKKAHVYHNIREFPNQFETILGERGVNLSGGQKQRLSIARAFVRKPKLVLFDDCLSAVDTETEEIILNNIEEEFYRATQVLVSHRLSSIRNAKKIIVLDHGAKIEEGSHDSLLQQKGYYAEMYEKQLIDDSKSD